MSKDILDMLFKVFDQHFCQEYLITQGYQQIVMEGQITDDENKKFMKFINYHPHKIAAMKLLKEEGVLPVDDMQKAIDDAINDKGTSENDSVAISAISCLNCASGPGSKCMDLWCEVYSYWTPAAYCNSSGFCPYKKSMEGAKPPACLAPSDNGCAFRRPV